MENELDLGSQGHKIARKPLLSTPLASPRMESSSPRSGMGPDSSSSEKNASFTKVSPGENRDSSQFEPWIDDRSVVRRWVTDWWLIELLSCVLSLAASAVIVGVLLRYDNRGLPSWPSYITLNSLLALFTTIAKAGLMIPIAEALGQLKWIWFSQAQRPLTDFQTFDEASRGTTGSFKLLRILKGRHLACLGAIISILGLGTSFITQQMIAYPTRKVYTPSNSSTAPASTSFDTFRFRGSANALTDLPILGAIQQGLYHPVNETLPVISPICAAGNCAWGSFSSLEVCSEIVDVSNKLYLNHSTGTQTLVNVTTGKNYTVPNPPNIFLPNGVYLSGETNNILNFTTLYPPEFRDETVFPNSTLTFGDKKDIAISDSFLIFSPNLQAANTSAKVALENYGAYEVIYYWCVKTHTAEVVNGKATTNTTNISTYVRPIPDSERNEFFGLANFTMSQSADSKDDFKVLTLASTALGQALVPIFTGVVYYNHFDTDTADIMNAYLWSVRNENATDAVNNGAQREFVANWTTNIATSITNNIRSRADKSTQAFGTSQTLESFVKVRWAWLSYLLTLFVLSFVFLIATIIKSSRSEVNILKSSALAVMCGMSEESRGNMKQIEMRGRIWQRAQRVSVRLVKKDRGWGLERNSS